MDTNVTLMGPANPEKHPPAGQKSSLNNPFPFNILKNKSGLYDFIGLSNIFSVKFIRP